MRVASCAATWPSEPRGSGGFGYDPAFVPEGESRTVGEMEAGEKDAISHRARAAAALREQLAAALQRARAVAAEPTTEAALAALNRARGCGLRVVAAMPDGEASHATVVADAAGNRSLLKWWQMAGGESDSLEHIERVVPLVERLRGRGYPSPRHLLTATAESLLFVLQELLPGRPPVPLLPVHVEQLVGLNRLQEDERGDEDGWGAFLCRTLTAAPTATACTLRCGGTRRPARRCSTA